MSVVESAFLGFIQGLSEFLPISSTAHLRIVPAFLGWDDPGAAYTAIIQLGSVLAVLLYFRKDLSDLIKGSIKDVRGKEARILWAIIIGTAPICVAGLLFKKSIETELRGLNIIASTLIGLALVLALAERFGSRKRDANTLSFWQIQLIGIAQALALVPGVSRSGVTLTAALFVGLKRDEAARFSFLLGIPAIAAAGLFQLKEVFESPIVPGSEMVLLTGIVTAFIFSLIAIDGLIRYLKTQSTTVFIVYRIILGIVIFIGVSQSLLR